MKFSKLFGSSLIALASFNWSHAQSLSSISLDIGFPDSYNGAVLAPKADFEFNNHIWSAGPTILFSYGDQIEQRESPKITGLAIGYTNFLNGKDKNVNLFLAFDLWYQRIKDEQASQYFDTGTNSFEPFTIEQTDNTFQIFAGFGASIKLTDRMDVRPSLGTGLNFTSRAATSPFNNFSDPLISQDWLLRIGLTYRLD